MSTEYPICELCEHYPGEDRYCPITAHYCEGSCMRASCSRFQQKRETVFDRITASLEVLAEKLVYLTEDMFGDVTWSSTIVPGWYVGREDCIAATVAKLKEDYAVEVREVNK